MSIELIKLQRMFYRMLRHDMTWALAGAALVAFTSRSAAKAVVKRDAVNRFMRQLAARDAARPRGERRVVSTNDLQAMGRRAGGAAAVGDADEEEEEVEGPQEGFDSSRVSLDGGEHGQKGPSSPGKRGRDTTSSGGDTSVGLGGLQKGLGRGVGGDTGGGRRPPRHSGGRTNRRGMSQSQSMASLSSIAGAAGAGGGGHHIRSMLKGSRQLAGMAGGMGGGAGGFSNQGQGTLRKSMSGDKLEQMMRRSPSESSLCEDCFSR